MIATRIRRIVKVLASLALVAGAATALGAWWVSTRPDPAYVSLPRTVVRRTDLHTSIKSGGLIESSQKTLIECEVEKIDFRLHGSTYNAGSTTILSLVDDGTEVVEGQVICQLDSSEFEELVREQEIKVEEERAEVVAAELALKVAQVALREYQEGTIGQQIRSLQGNIALGEADLRRMEDRLDWSERMLNLGYLSISKYDDARFTLMQGRQSLKNLKLQLANLKRYSEPAQLLALGNNIESAQARLHSERVGLSRNEDRLEMLREQIENCTIRAPHDGMLVYARNRRDSEPRVYVGAPVREHMDLFQLPNLKSMEAQAILHESVVQDVKRGMPARVRVEGTPFEMEGEVLSVATLPEGGRKAFFFPDLKTYIARIKLHAVAPGVLPGMTAEVEIHTGHHPDALVIPPVALNIERGRDVCYVAGPDGRPERRPVKIGASTPEALQVVSGLNEGDVVFLEAPPAEIIVEPADGPGDAPLPAVAEANTAEVFPPPAPGDAHLTEPTLR